MKRNPIFTGIISAALAVPTFFALTSAQAQAATTGGEIAQALEMQALKEAGYTFPAIEELMRDRKFAQERVEAMKAVKAAKAGDEKTSVKN